MLVILELRLTVVLDWNSCATHAPIKTGFGTPSEMLYFCFS